MTLLLLEFSVLSIIYWLPRAGEDHLFLIHPHLVQISDSSQFVILIGLTMGVFVIGLCKYYLKLNHVAHLKVLFYACKHFSISLEVVFFYLLVFSRSVVFDSLATPWTVARQAPLSVGFPKQEHWTELSFPSPGDLPDPGIKPKSPASLLHCRQSILTWRIPWTEEPGRLQSTGSQRVGHDWATSLHFTSLPLSHWRSPFFWLTYC